MKAGKVYKGWDKQTQKQIGVLAGRAGRRFWRDYSQESVGFGNNPATSVWCEGDVGVEHDTEIVSLSVTQVRVVHSKEGWGREEFVVKDKEVFF